MIFSNRNVLTLPNRIPRQSTQREKEIQKLEERKKQTNERDRQKNCGCSEYCARSFVKIVPQRGVKFG